MNRLIAFHEVYDSNWFEQVIIYLKRNYKMVSMDDINGFYNGSVFLNNSCHITVDDGHISFYQIIYPIIKKHNVPVTLFISPHILRERTNYWFQEIKGYNAGDLKKSIAFIKQIPIDIIEKYNEVWLLKTFKIKEILKIIELYQCSTNTSKKTYKNITLENLKELDRSRLVTIGAHTMTHPILMNEDDTTSKHEIGASVKELSLLLNKEVLYFAYPNGKANLDFTAREEIFLKSFGIQLAVTTKGGNLCLKDNRMRLPRLCISDRKSLSIVKAKLILGNYWDSLQKIKSIEEVVHRKKFLAKNY